MKFTYLPEEDVEDDCTKIWHNIKLEDGRTVHCDWSPYSLMRKEEIELWLELGMPARIGVGPLDLGDLKAIKGIRESGSEAAKTALERFHALRERAIFTDEYFELRKELRRLIAEEMPFILAIERHEDEN